MQYGYLTAGHIFPETVKFQVEVLGPSSVPVDWFHIQRPTIVSKDLARDLRGNGLYKKY